MDSPEIIKKEFDSLKESIFEEASIKEKAEKIQALIDANQDKHIVKNREAIESLKKGK